MNLLRVACAVTAILCGFRAFGYWVILRRGGVQPSESSGIALILCSSALPVFFASVASAYIRERARGTRAIAGAALYLTGVYGLPAIAVFTVASRGAVLQMPEIAGLLLLFACFVLVFRLPVPKRA